MIKNGWRTIGLYHLTYTFGCVHKFFVVDGFVDSFSQKVKFGGKDTAKQGVIVYVFDNHFHLFFLVIILLPLLLFALKSFVIHYLIEFNYTK
jgi:hypothetical protein